MPPVGNVKVGEEVGRERLRDWVNGGGESEEVEEEEGWSSLCEMGVSVGLKRT